MENNNLLVEKYNKIYTLEAIEDPRIFSNIVLFKKVAQDFGVSEFVGQNKSGQPIRIYFANKKARQYDTNIIYLSSSPNILLIEGQGEDMIIETGAQLNLEKWLYYHELKTNLPYIKEMDARRIITQLNESAANFASRSLTYDCLSARNAVFNHLHNKWELSLVGYLFSIDKDHNEYCKQMGSSAKRMVFSMACLFFKLIYGFSPATDNNFELYSNCDYLQNLKSSSTNKMLKIYYFCERDPLISRQCKELLQEALSGKLSWETWINHEYFKPIHEQQLKQDYNKGIRQGNVFVRMTADAKPANYSIIVAAINYKESHPYEMLNQKPEYINGKLSSEELEHYFTNHPAYKNIDRSKFVQQDNESQLDENEIKIKNLHNSKYFNNEDFDAESSYPCRQLIKLIERHKEWHPQFFNNEKYERKLKLHGYPYALGFQLLKVASKQPVHIQSKISQAFELLMRLSTFNLSENIPVLVAFDPKFKHFDEIKPQFRSNLNQLYQYFLNEAMRKYNSKTDKVNQEVIRSRKAQGLEYYRLCLKILEGSLLMRKQGADLFLEKIETNSRRQIQCDITNLLKTFFPQKPQIH